MRRLFSIGLSLVTTSLLSFGCSAKDSPSTTEDTGVPTDTKVDAPADTFISGPIDLAIDTFNVGLAGSFVPNEAVRRAAVVKALAEYDTDVLCLQEAWFQADKDAIVAGTKAKLPYSASFVTDLDTKVVDAADEKGVVPPAYTTAPCSGPTLKTGMEAAVDCVKTNCNTIPGSDDGKTTGTDCASSKCIGSAAALLGADDQRCYGCLAASLPASTFKQMRDECTTKPNAGLTFGGQSSVVLLSKYPLSNVENHILPGTWNRRTVVRATVTLPNRAEVDVYCTHLTAVFDGFTYPYTGQYGGGETGKLAWQNEQLLQTKKVITWMASRPGRRAVFLGDMNATREDKVHGIEGYATVALDTLEKSFSEALTASHVPSCTFCRDNPNTPGDENTWLDHIYLSGVPKTAVKSSGRAFDKAIVDGILPRDGGKAGKVPLSDHYGFRSVVTIAP